MEAVDVGEVALMDAGADRDGRDMRGYGGQVDPEFLEQVGAAEGLRRECLGRSG